MRDFKLFSSAFLSELLEIFLSVDRIRTSRVSKNDFFRALSENITFNDDEIEDLFSLLQIEGQVNYKEIWHKINEFNELSENEKITVEHFRDEYFDDIETIKKHLKRADTDKDDKNTFDEVTRVLEKLGISVKEGVQEIFNLLDVQNESKIQISEFLVFLQSSLWESS